MLKAHLAIVGALALMIASSASHAGDAYTPDKGTATIKGTVSYDGPEIKRPTIEIPDAGCAAMHAAAPLKKEQVVVKDGKLANVIVYVKSGAEKWTFTPPADAVVFTQEGCQYKPHVFAVMADQPINITNGDAFAHNVHGTSPSKANAEFNVAQSVKGASDVKKLKEAELPFRINCDVHKWMEAYVGVFTHPFFAVSKEDGTFEIKLPAGDYEIAVWHESGGKKLDEPDAVKVSVKDGEAKTQDFTFKKK